MNARSSPKARIVTRQSIVSLHILKTGLRETASRRFNYGKIRRKFANIDKNIKMAGITTTNTGQFSTDIETMIPMIENPVNAD